MDVNELLIADFVIHVGIKAEPNVGNKLIKGILWVILPSKLLVKVHVHQACLQLHKTKISRVIGIVHLKAFLAVDIIDSKVVLQVYVLRFNTVENFTEVS